MPHRSVYVSPLRSRADGAEVELAGTRRSHRSRNRRHPRELRRLDRRALDEGLTIRGGEPNRSKMARIMLAYASAHMPKSWRPRGADSE